MKKRKISILLPGMIAIAMVCTFSGCIKSSHIEQPPAKAYVSIMHLAPTAPSLDVFFNDDKVSRDAFPPGNVTQAYNAVDKGAFSIKFKKSSSDSLVATVSPAQYDSLNYYTIFLYNLQADGPVNAVRIIDDFSNLTGTNTLYRFFHASPNTAAVDLYIDNVKIENGRMLADNANSGSLNTFRATTSGFHIIEAKLAGTSTVVATLNNADLSTGNAYTLYLRGLNGGSATNQLSIGLLRAVN